MKKVVITAFDVNTARKAGRTSVAVPDAALITPQAADDAREYGIALVRGAVEAPAPSPPLPAPAPAPFPGRTRPSSGVPHPQTRPGADMAAQVRRLIVERLGDTVPASLDFVIASVMAQTSASSGGGPGKTSFVRNAGSVRLVSSSALPRENSGPGSSGVNMVEALPPGAAHPGVAYMRWENSSFAWTFRYDEVLVVLEGDITLTVDGAALAGKSGDTFLIPAGNAVTLSAKGAARCVHSSWPNPATAKG